MAARRAARAAGIRGPQSALTDYLASNNISASDIHHNYQQRVRDAERAQAEEDAAKVDENEDENTKDIEAMEERKKRERKEAKALMKIKQSKEFKRMKHKHDSDESEYEDDDALARKMLAQSKKPVPGQFEHCETCKKRFIVTNYSKSGPAGGLLCAVCSKQLLSDDKKEKNPVKKGPARGRRRQTESARMMGDVKPGARSLVDICVKKVADNIYDVEEFGLLHQRLLDKLSKILSKQRVMDSRTLQLFLRDDSTKIDIYDAAKLETDDFIKILALIPELEEVNFRNAGQFKDRALIYALEKCDSIQHLTLDAANLVTNSVWLQFFIKQGPKLQTFKTSFLDAAMDDEALGALATHGHNLHRLKLRRIWKVTPQVLVDFAQLPNLNHLTLSIANDAEPKILSQLVTQTGPELITLCLESYIKADDTVLKAIHNSCHVLEKLRLNDNAVFTDAGFAALFTGWSNPPLRHVDLSDTRSVDNANPGGPQEAIGLGDAGFNALMAQARPLLRHLNIQSCRHVSRVALLQVFGTKSVMYPQLRTLDLSFVAQVDDDVVNAVFASCPRLEKLVIFGCNQVKTARVPPSVAVVGLMNAMANMILTR